MSEAYEEWVEGERLLRLPPRPRHESILERLRQDVERIVRGLKSTQMLGLRAPVPLKSGTIVRPDMSLVARATNKLWLAVEVISADDHHADTVTKKMVYEEQRLPRLWIIDPRYDNVEIYHGTSYGLTLKETLAGRDTLKDSLLPNFQLPLHELFAGRFDGAGRWDI